MINEATQENNNKEVRKDSFTRKENHHQKEIILEKHHLELLLIEFKNGSSSRAGSKASAKSSLSPTAKQMDCETFSQTLSEIIKRDGLIQNDDLINSSCQMLFKKIDWRKRGIISWDDICSYFILESKDSEEVIDKQSAFVSQPHIVKFSTLKDNISKLVPESNPSRFILVTKTGHICMFTSDLCLSKKLHMEDPLETSLDEVPKKRRTKLWVTDCVCIKELNKLVICTANRDLQIFDLSTPHCSQQFQLYALPNAVLCMVYHYIPSTPYDQLWLFFGTDNGDVHWLKFHMANKSLFQMPFKKTDSCWKILFSDLANQSKYISHQLFSHMHSDWVRRLQYVPQGDLLFSCSSNGRDSLVYRSLDETKRKVYVFKVTKGIECFAYNKELALIATGGVDHVLRLWDPYVTSKPMAILKTHQTSIIDVMIYEPLQQVVSYSKDGVIMTWDIKDQSPLQHLSIKFPFTGTVLEHGGFPLCLTSHGSLFVAAEDCIAELKLTTAGAHRQNASHKGCVVAVYHIPHKNQIISASEFGDICTWSLDSGRKSSTIQTNQKSKEVLAFTIDKNAEFAVTGHIDGSGQLWNLISGKQEKTLAAYSDEEITNCIALPNASIIFMLGWSKKILMYKNTNQYKKLTTLRPDTGWLSISSHKDDIISAAFWEPHFLATGTFDGDIFIWHIEHERLWRKIQIGRGQPLFQSLVNQYIMPPRTARSGRRREKQHQVLRVSDEERPPTNQQQKEHGEYTMPVDLLLYLGHRDHETYASLIATEGNRVNWWSTTAIGTPVASFTISEDTEKVITAITSDLDNRYVIVGTNQGEVSIWNIVTYGVYRRFADVVREGTPSTPKSTPLTETFRERPPCVHTWSCRSMDMIVSLCCFKRDKEMVAVGLETGCISLFALSGDYIGMFSQIEPWNLTESSERIQTKSPNIEEPQRELCTEKDEEEEEKVDLNIKNDVHNNEAENLVGEPADVQQSQSLPELGVSNRPPIPASTTGSVGGNTKDNTISNDVQKMKKTEYYQTISSINDDIVQQKAAWSLLGEKYNSNFKRRMQERLSRRRHFSDVTVASGDKPLLQHSGGLGNLCSPFQALSTKDCEDFVLPKGLPITSRMTAHSIDPYNGNSLEQMSSFGH